MEIQVSGVNLAEKVTVRGDNFDDGGYFVDHNSSDNLEKLLFSLYSKYSTPVREIYTNALEVNDRSRGKIIVEIKANSVYNAENNLNLLKQNITSGSIYIKDNGCGMSKDFMLRSFKGLGISTKNEVLEDGTDKTIGGYGLGAKSASFISNDVVWKSTKDGETTTLIISKDENGSTESTSFSESTDESNGTSVNMAVSGEVIEYIVNHLGSDLFDYQNPEDVDVFVNGKPFVVGEKYREESVKGDYVFAFTGEVGRSNTITVLAPGNVPYVLDSAEKNAILNDIVESGEYNYFSFDKDKSIVVSLPKLNRNFIAPTRESLVSSKKLRNHIRDLIASSFASEVDNFVTSLKSAKSYEEWFSLVFDKIDDENSLMFTKINSYSRSNNTWTENINKLMGRSFRFKRNFLIDKDKTVKKSSILVYEDEELMRKALHVNSSLYSSAQLLTLGARISSKFLKAFLEEHDVYEFFNWSGFYFSSNPESREKIDSSMLFLPEWVDDSEISTNYDFFVKFANFDIINFPETKEKAMEEGKRIVKEKTPPNQKDSSRKAETCSSSYIFYLKGEISTTKNAPELVENHLLKSGLGNNERIFFFTDLYESNAENKSVADLLDGFTREQKKFMETHNVPIVISREASSSRSRGKASITRALNKNKSNLRINETKKSNLSHIVFCFMAQEIEQSIKKATNVDANIYPGTLSGSSKFNKEELKFIHDIKVSNRSILSSLIPNSLKPARKTIDKMFDLAFVSVEESEKKDTVSLISLCEYFEILRDLKVISYAELEVFRCSIFQYGDVYRTSQLRRDKCVGIDKLELFIKINIKNIKSLRSLKNAD